MALIECPECASQISSRATSCPKCGMPIAMNDERGVTTTQSTAKRYKVQFAFAGLVFWIGLVWFIFAVVAASQGHAKSHAPVMPGGVMLAGAVWMCAAKVCAWWHHR